MLIGKDAAIHPAAAGGAAVILQLLEALDLLAVGDGVAVDLAQHGLGDQVRRLRPLVGIVPGQLSGSAASRGLATVGVELLSAAGRDDT